MNRCLKIIEKICKDNKIDLKKVSEDWVLILNKNNITSYIVGYKFDLNSQGTAEICDDKFALYEVLKKFNIPVIDHKIIFRDEENEVKNIFLKYNENIVIKSNTGTCGNEVFHVTNIKELMKIYSNLQVKNFSMSICPFYNIKNEYRVIFLDSVKYIYKKQNVVVYGDGITTYKDLIYKFNPIFFTKNMDKIQELTYIPKAGEKLEFEWKFNLSKGAIIQKVSEEESKILSEIAKDASKAINLRIGSIDIIKTSDDEYKVIEINSGLMMENLIELLPDGNEIVYNIYEEAMLKMIEEGQSE